MKRLFFDSAIVLSLVVLASPAEADETRDGAKALEAKLIGSWKGEGPCTGAFVFRADHTYEQLHPGPGDNDSSGAWELRWDALPPTLALTCKVSKDRNCLGNCELQLVELSDSAMAVRYYRQVTSAAQYERQKP